MLLKCVYKVVSNSLLVFLDFSKYNVSGVPITLFLRNSAVPQFPWKYVVLVSLVNTEILIKEYTLLPLPSLVVHATLQKHHFNTIFVGNTTRILKLPIIFTIPCFL